MKTIIVLVLPCLFLIISCNDGITSTIGPPPPPIYSHIAQGIYGNNDKLGFSIEDGDLKILDLKTGDIQLIDFRSKLPSNVLYDCYAGSLVCPYNSNRICVFLVTGTDTIGDKKSYAYGVNWYIMSLDGSEFKKITPTIFGKAGSYLGIGSRSWLKKSSINEDYFYMGGNYGMFIPQKDTFVNYPDKGRYYSFSPDNKYCFDTNLDTVIEGNSLYKFFINKTEFFLRKNM